MEGGHQKMIKIQMPVYLEDDFKKVPKYFSTFANLLMPLKIQILFYAQIKKSFLVSIGDSGQKPPLKTA